MERNTRIAVTLLALVALAFPAAAVSQTGGVPSLKLARLKSCLKADAYGLQNDIGVRSTTYAFVTDLDPNVNALIVLSGHNPNPNTVTRIVTGGRKPVISQRFANIRIDAYVFFRNGVRPLPKAITSLTHEVIGDVRTCVAAAR